MIRLKGSYASQIFILILILCFSSVSGYEVVHYDDFKYTANYTGLVNEHDFFNDAGIQGCTASYGTEHYLLCYSSASKYTTQKFNLRDPASYCISGNGTINGGARNFSIRGRVRGSETWKPYSVSDTWRLYASSGNATSDASFPLFVINSSSTTRMLFYRIATSYTGFINPIDYTWYDFQIDYYTQNNGGLNEVYASNFSVCNSSLSCTSQYNGLSTPRPFNCINTTRTLYRNGYYLDYVMVFTYADGEAFIPLTEAIADYYSVADNEMPVFSVNTENKYGLSTNSVMQTITGKCTGLATLEDLQKEDECNPLFFDILASDAESDTIYYALDCGQSEDSTDFFLLEDSFSDDLETLKVRYDMTGCNNTKSSLDAFSQAIRFDQSANCSILTSRFSNDYPEEQKYLYPNFDIFLEMRFNLKGNNRQLFQFNALDGSTPLILGFAYNSTLDRVMGYSGNSCCLISPIKDYEIPMDNLSDFTLRILLNKETNEYMYSLRNANDVFFSESIAFNWVSPITSMQVYADNPLTPFLPVNAGQLFGNFSMFSLDSLPSFIGYTMGQMPNCTKNTPDDWQSYVFMTDIVHSDNYLNYDKVFWFTGYPDISGMIPTDAETEDFLDMLTGGNEFLKIFFAMIIIIVLMVGTIISVSSWGWNYTTNTPFFIAAIVGCFAMIVFSFIGLLPFWIPILMIIICGLVITYLITRPFTGG